jgi:hypothetical protein
VPSPMHVHALTTDRGGCFHYRIRQPLTEMRKYGHWTSWGGGCDQETWDRADVLVSQYLHLPTTVDIWKQSYEIGKKLMVWEADDDIFAVHNQPAHGNAYDDPETLPRMLDMIQHSHLVTTTTEALANVYRKVHPNVVVLPNCVPDWLPNYAPLAAKVPEPQVVLGYTGSASHFEDFTEWAPTLDRWMRRNSHRTLLRFYGHNKRPIGMPLTYRCETHKWVRQTSDYLKSLSMDVGVAFVKDTPFNRVKSGIKAQEYAAIGVPSVCTDAQQYRDVVVNGVTGFLVQTQGQWIQAFQELWDDPGRRQEMGIAAWEYARENFVQSKHVNKWIDAYRTGLEGLR